MPIQIRPLAPVHRPPVAHPAQPKGVPARCVGGLFSTVPWPMTTTIRCVARAAHRLVIAAIPAGCRSTVALARRLRKAR